MDGRQPDDPTVFGSDYPARADQRTHIDTTNRNPEGYSPAWLPGAARWHPPEDFEPRRPIMAGERKSYQLLEPAYLNDRIVPQGEVVWMTEEEVGQAKHFLAVTIRERVEEGLEHAAELVETVKEEHPAEFAKVAEEVKREDEPPPAPRGGKR